MEYGIPQTEHEREIGSKWLNNIPVLLWAVAWWESSRHGIRDFHIFLLISPPVDRTVYPQFSVSTLLILEGKRLAREFASSD